MRHKMPCYRTQGLGVSIWTTMKQTAVQVCFHLLPSEESEVESVWDLAALPAPDYGVDSPVNFSYPCLIQTSAANHIHFRHAIAIGDGANDLPMMGTAGLSMSYHATPRVR